MITFEELERFVDLSVGNLSSYNPAKSRFGIYYQPYYYLFSLLAEGLCVELGVEQGRGCISMLDGAELVIGIDSLKRREIDILLDQYDNFVFLEQPSLPPPDILKGRKIDFLHIDTEHSYSMAKAEFETYKPFLNNPAVVFFDDLHAMDDGVLDYFNSLPYQKIHEDRLHPECGYGVLYYTSDALDLVDAHTLQPLPDIEKGKIW